MSGRTRRLVASIVAGAALATTAACGSSSPAASSGSTTTQAPKPAGRSPSAISTMVCSAKAQKELATPLGVTATISAPTWVGHVYACRYQYGNGYFDLSVHELSSWRQTYAYFDGLGGTLGNTGKVTGLGQGAFATANGSIVVRKDWKVLLVDISGLPASFGVPATSAADVAYTIADVIMGCWAGD